MRKFFLLPGIFDQSFSSTVSAFIFFPPKRTIRILHVLFATAISRPDSVNSSELEKRKLVTSFEGGLLLQFWLKGFRATGFDFQ